MTQNSLIASEIRIEWAGEKLDQLETFIQRAIDNALKIPISESDKERMKVLLDLSAAVTPEARRLVSEYALQARAVLDYIAFDLAFRNHGAEKRHTQFPIHSCPEEFPWKLDETTGIRKRIGCVKHLTPEQVALIERATRTTAFRCSTCSTNCPTETSIDISLRSEPRA